MACCYLNKRFLGTITFAINLNAFDLQCFVSSLPNIRFLGTNTLAINLTSL
jgi:hypothetical protein